MRNWMTIAIASAILGGIAIFSLEPAPSVDADRDGAHGVPAQLASVDAKPIKALPHVDESDTSQIEVASYNPAPTALTVTSVLLAQAPAPGSAAGTPKIRGIFKENSTASDKQILSSDPRTKASTVYFQVEFPEADDQVPKGVLTIRIGKSGSVREVQLNIADKSKKTPLLEVDVSSLQTNQAEEVVALWDPEGDGERQQLSSPSEPARLFVDNIPPRILAVRLVGETGGVGVLELQFAHNDLKKETITAGNFVIHRTSGQHDFATAHANFTVLDRTDDSFVVRLNLGSLVTDLYQIEVKAAVTDRHGNALAEPRKFTFNSLAEAGTGAHVPFPEFVRRKERQPQELFNPGDKVETRVARLYYIRDAHRVAQIINRNVKSYNQSGVANAKLTAKNARETAEQATRERQNRDREAIRAADANRHLERELAAARQELEQLRAVLAQRDATAKQSPQGQPDVPVPANSNGPLLEAIRTAAARVGELERAVADKRQVENSTREQAEQAQALEDRARENQFRAEVAAGTEDPDTYVPGDVKSEDPVTQVSISVIGEGVLQLRGPIRGINKIRTMINQIDTPLGQVKVGIFTVQVNGEHGDRMEKVAGRVEGHVDLSRFLTNQSLGYLRRAIQEVAGAVVANVDAQFPNQHRQLDRDRKYLYAFFGRDFIDELYEMDSEFLRTENKLLSLHGMDTVSQSQACFIMALSKNDVRQQILDRFRCLVEYELPQAEWDYRKTSSLLPCKLNSQKEVFRNAFERYKFRNLHGFFETTVYGPDTMTPMQREFIRLAQIFKSQMVAEAELKQRVIERGMIEDASNDELERAAALTGVRHKALQRLSGAFESLVEKNQKSKEIKERLKQLRTWKQEGQRTVNKFTLAINRLSLHPTNRLEQAFQQLKAGVEDRQDQDLQDLLTLQEGVKQAQESELLHPVTKEQIQEAWGNVQKTRNVAKATIVRSYGERVSIQESVEEDLSETSDMFERVDALIQAIDDPRTPSAKVHQAWKNFEDGYKEYQTAEPVYLGKLRELCLALYELYVDPERQVGHAENIAKRVRRDLDHRKLLEFLIDEQEEKFIELVEGTRSHIAQIDNYLKRLAIALEDDFKVQFYDPAFAGVRAASREWDVNLGQVERTTILTNNRQFAKVEPQATMEFDLPKRAPMIVEGMNGARSLVQEYGTLLQDPTFLSLSGMMSGSPVSAISGGAGTPVPGLPNQGLRTASVRNVLPGQSTDSAEQLMAQTGGPDRKFGASLEALIPDPAIYKFETGTGFEIRPVIQPDGHSVIYDFDYMYTTNVREPVRPDEKHLGRVKRHFIHTQVQTSSFELREISRYQVALKASRTSRGVPLLEDIPGAGVLFRPLPSDESSLQQNIILAQSTVYPTLFDLMGLRWSKYVVDLDHIALRDLEHVTRGREQSIHDFTFDEASKRVDEFLDIQGKHDQHLRPDLYHQQRIPSPNHPGGYQYPANPPPADPHNRNFTIPDRRPEEFRNPPYDALRRNPIDPELRQIPNPGSQPEDMDLRLMPPENVPLQESSSRSSRAIRPQEGSRKSAAVPKAKSQGSTIQPAKFEQPATTPQPISGDIDGHGRKESPAQPTTPEPPKKKSWLNKLKPR